MPNSAFAITATDDGSINLSVCCILIESTVKSLPYSSSLEQGGGEGNHIHPKYRYLPLKY